MYFSRILVALSITGSTIAFQGKLGRRDDDTKPTEPDVNTADAPKRFIVEFAEGVDATAAAAELSRSSNTTVLKVFNSGIFSGAAVLASKDNLDSLRAFEPVLQAWQSKKIMLAPSIGLKSFSKDATALNYSIHGMTGVDKLHAQGILGKGVTVAVVDTGIDYLHSAFGGGYGPGFKVAGGYDLVGDGAWPNDHMKAPDADPMDYVGHGTHVSGIIAGKTDLFTGVAPEANLLVYKVFATMGSTDDDALIQAFLMAYEAGADIITSSVAAVSGWTDGAWAVVASRLVDQGVVVTICAGNDGSAGAFAASGGSAGEHVLAVASVDADVLASASFLGTFNLDGFSNTTYIAYRAPVDWYPSNVTDWPIYPLALDTSIVDDGCNPLPTGTPDLSKKVVLVRRGGCDFSQKQRNIAAFGASNILAYNNESILVIPYETDPKPLMASITAEAGKAIVETIKAGGNVTADFTVYPTENLVGVENGVRGGLASSFTSIGPTNDLFIKPDIAAPGGQIFSSFAGGGWATRSGTSMACPYVAGVAALYISKHGGRKIHGPGFAKNLAMRIISSGESIRWDDGDEQKTDYGFYASVAQVGTGLINATKILNYDTSLSFSKFALNDTHHFSPSRSVDITNAGTNPITYTFEAQDAGGIETYNTDPTSRGTPRLAWFEELIVSPKKMVPTISFPIGTFTVTPGQTKTARYSFAYPSGLNATKLPLYSGKVLIKGSNGEILSVPYMGLAADLHRDLGMNQMFTYPIGLPRITSTTSNISIAEKANFTFDLSIEKQDFPHLSTRFDYGTTELRWDIFISDWKEQDWKYPPVIGQAGYVGSTTSWSQSFNKKVFNSSVDVVNDVVALPLRNVPRSILGGYGTELWWLGRLANGSQIAAGKYKMRFAALVPFGTPGSSDDWDVFPTPEFEVLKL